MKIRAQQYLSAGVSAALVLLMGAILFISSHQASYTFARHDLAADIMLASTELRFVMFEYILSHDQRPKMQWQRRQASLGSLLARDLYEGTDQERSMDRLRQLHRQMKGVFARVEEAYQAPGGSPGEIARSRALEVQLVNELLDASQETVLTVLRLARAVDAELAQAQRREKFLLIAFVVLMGCMVAINAYVIRRQVLIPIARLGRGAAIVGAGDLEHRTGIGGDDEIGALSLAFDRMVAEVQLSHATLEQRVSERTTQIEAANKEMEAFAYSVSHDLRVPLRAVDGFSHMLEKKCRDGLGDEGRRLIGVVRDNTRRMGRLIDDILAFSRMGRKEIVQYDLDMGALARAVADELASSRTGRDLQLQIGELPRARGDPTMLRQVWVNLLANAIKFTRPKPSAHIEVGAREEPGENIYYVKDDGAGFDMQYASKLFGVFQRLHGVEEFEGTGIGLAIVQRIVARHGGRVWAEGKVNEGATFYFALPKPGSPSSEDSVPAP